jgi:hypothetical protein
MPRPAKPQVNGFFPRLPPKVWIPSLITLVAVSLAVYRRSFQSYSFTGALLLQQSAEALPPSRTRLQVPGANAPPGEGDLGNKIDKPLNVVILYGDDWRHDAIGVAGNQPVETPFIDWMARNMGIRFTHNMVTTSICWISRATLHTGMYMSRHKAEQPAHESWYEFFDTSFPALMRKAGYYVSHIGKKSGGKNCDFKLFV